MGRLNLVKIRFSQNAFFIFFFTGRVNIVIKYINNFSWNFYFQCLMQDDLITEHSIEFTHIIIPLHHFGTVLPHCQCRTVYCL